MPTRVIVLRHGQTYGTIEQLFCGHSETDLTPLGIEQARAAGRRLAAESLDGAVASDLSRARKTAEYALGEAAAAPTLAIDPRLREMHYGDWEAHPAETLAERYRDHMREFFACRQHAPNGESFPAIRERMAAAFHDAVRAHEGGTVLLVTHGNAIMALVAELLRMPLESTWATHFDNCSLTRFTVAKSGRVTLTASNETAHLG
ncbi:MAG: histidine phosphatase family protein [Dehalococcoidia bacterium]|nr:histidine phosphatase family protein [Dehalococcoidia bacterium]